MRSLRVFHILQKFRCSNANFIRIEWVCISRLLSFDLKLSFSGDLIESLSALQFSHFKLNYSLFPLEVIKTLSKALLWLQENPCPHNKNKHLSTQRPFLPTFGFSSSFSLILRLYASRQIFFSYSHFSFGCNG